VTNKRRGQKQSQVLRVRRSQDARGPFDYAQGQDDNIRRCRERSCEKFSSLECGLADDPGGHAALILDYGGLDGID
jgi:hypothetical protein